MNLYDKTDDRVSVQRNWRRRRTCQDLEGDHAEGPHVCSRTELYRRHLCVFGLLGDVGRCIIHLLVLPGGPLFLGGVFKTRELPGALRFKPENM